LCKRQKFLKSFADAANAANAAKAAEKKFCKQLCVHVARTAAPAPASTPAPVLAQDEEVTIYPEHWLSFAPVGSCNDYISKKLQHQYIYSINDERFFQEWSQVPSLFQDTF
jgi:hypothetical protein